MIKDLKAGDPVSVGPYKLLRRLGAGGMGQVYLAKSPGGRLVAIKLIRPELAEERGFRARFAGEIAAARGVSGIYTAAVVDADAEAELPWMATVYVPGPSLTDAVEDNGALPVKTVLALAAGLAEALQAIHRAGLVHRDMKPSNVLLAADGPRVIDFGISRALERSMMTTTGMVLGSPGFMSPEQAMGEQVGQPTDVFSLGAVLAYAATGSGPFGTGPTPALLYRVVKENPDLSELPERLRPLVEQCLAKDPADRPAPADLLGSLSDEVGVLTDEWLPQTIAEGISRYNPTVKTPLPPALREPDSAPADAVPAETPAPGQAPEPAEEAPAAARAPAEEAEPVTGLASPAAAALVSDSPAPASQAPASPVPASPVPASPVPASPETAPAPAPVRAEPATAHPATALASTMPPPTELAATVPPATALAAAAPPSPPPPTELAAAIRAEYNLPETSLVPVPGGPVSGGLPTVRTPGGGMPTVPPAWPAGAGQVPPRRRPRRWPLLATAAAVIVIAAVAVLLLRSPGGQQNTPAPGASLAGAVTSRPATPGSATPSKSAAQPSASAVSGGNPGSQASTAPAYTQSAASTQSGTPTPTASATTRPTATPTATPSSSATGTPTQTSTATATATATTTATPTSTATSSPTPLPSPTGSGAG